jgi:hypothetical protein
MIGVAAEGIIQLLFHIIVEIFFIGTGEIILYIISLGKRKPVWKWVNKGGSTKLAILIDLSFIIGFIFWLSLAWLIFK